LNNGQITIIIPNINGKEHLETCFSSIAAQKYNNYKLILVDNNSTDGSVELVQTNYPQAEIIRFDYNSGFAKAVNAGIKIAMSKYNSQYILLLNNDIELGNNFLQTAADTFDKIPQTDIIAVKMMNFFNRDIIDDTGNFITKKGGTSYARGNGEKDEGQYDKAEFIFGACAGAAFYRKGVFEKAGYFDEDFFAYLEDIDLSFRAQLAGLKCYYQPDAVCYHKRGGSAVSTFKFQARMNERNIIWVRIKNYPLILYILYQPLFFLSRVRRLYLILRIHGFQSFLSAFMGYIQGILKSVFQLPKRFSVQRLKKVNYIYIYGLFR
jgi:GT2 family glycosyltransferase